MSISFLVLDNLVFIISLALDDLVLMKWDTSDCF